MYLELITTDTPCNVFKENVKFEVEFYSFNALFRKKMFFVYNGRDIFLGIPFLKYRHIDSDVVISPSRCLIIKRDKELERKLEEYEKDRPRFNISKVEKRFSALDMYRIIKDGIC